MTRTPTAILSELLVLNAQGGDTDSLARLVELWTPRLRSRAYRLTREHEASSEVLQESWVAIARGLRSLRDPALFGAWAMRIVHHKASDWIKARTKQRTHEARLREIATQPEQEKEEDHSRMIREAIGQLDRRLRDVVYLFYMDNCSLEQIAVVLDIPAGTAKTRLSRARNQLRPILEKTLERTLEQTPERTLERSTL